MLTMIVDLADYHTRGADGKRHEYGFERVPYGLLTSTDLLAWVSACSLLADEYLAEGVGGATPAVCEPSPNCCSVFASSLPEGFNPCPAWNFFIALTVESSHLPFGEPEYDPFFANAC